MNITLFDSDYHSLLPNKCEVNHFHIYIENDLEWPFKNNNAHLKGVFMHEYIHYLQHLSTLCGISLSRHYNLLFCKYRQYFADNTTIPIPLTWDIVAPEMRPFFEYFEKIKGSKRYASRIDSIDVSDVEIQTAWQEKRAVRIDTFDRVRSQWNRNDLCFGYYAIIESMADMVQRIYDPDVEHDDVPYLVVQKICEAIYPDVAQDINMMISLCTCALMSSNPGCGFFDAIDYAKSHKDLNGADLYHAFLKDSTVIIKGEKITIAEMFERQLTDYNLTIEQALGITDYYCEAIKSSLKCANMGNNLLLLVLYDESVSPDEYFTILSKYYGSPYIEARNQSLYPGRKSMPQDVASAIGLELIYKSISSTDNTTCPRIIQCRRTGADSYDCINGNQWSRITPCPFLGAKQYFQLEGKLFDPQLLNRGDR